MIHVTGTPRPRILLIASGNTTSGGGERHVVDLMIRLPAKGFDVALAAPSGGDLIDRARSLGIPAQEVPMHFGSSLRGLRAMRAALTRSAPDVVHAHGTRAATFARVADGRVAARLVYTVHGIHVNRAGSSLRRTTFSSIERLLRERTARFITVCDADAQVGAQEGFLIPDRTRTVHNGIEPPELSLPRGHFRAELGIGPLVPLVLSVGRLEKQKDQGTLLKAWAIVCRSHREALLALVGAGEYESELRSLIDTYGLENRVRLVTPRPEIAQAYLDADVFALCSLWEGLPYVVLEAMAHGLPVASTEVGGIPEIVTDGVSGLLVPPHDPEALAGRLSGLLSDPEKRRRLGESGRQRVTSAFSLDDMVTQTIEVYRELLR